MVAGFNGVAAGLVGRDGRWKPEQAPRGKSWNEVVDGTTYERELVVLFDRDSRELLVARSGSSDWTSLRAPVASSQSLMSVSSDPFDPSTLYVSTAGQGVFIYRPFSAPVAGVAAGGASK